jgi:hypothetical protein
LARQTYVGLGPIESAVQEFNALAPYVLAMLDMRDECVPQGADWAAMGIAFDGLESTAYHFTRRRNFYHPLSDGRLQRAGGNGRLTDRQEAIAAFKGLRPYAARLMALQSKCRPFGRDYLALEIAKKSLETAAFHFTRIERFYGAQGDSAGPVRPAF